VENGILVSMSHKIPSLRHGIIVALFRFPSDRDHESSSFPAPCSAMFGVLLYSQHSQEPTNCCTASNSIEMDHDARRTTTRGECHYSPFPRVTQIVLTNLLSPSFIRSILVERIQMRRLLLLLSACL
jgi:hypothetical protein